MEAVGICSNLEWDVQSFHFLRVSLLSQVSIVPRSTYKGSRNDDFSTSSDEVRLKSSPNA